MHLLVFLHFYRLLCSGFIKIYLRVYKRRLKIETGKNKDYKKIYKISLLDNVCMYFLNTHYIFTTFL